ncbi:hypothetical protein MASR2M16_34210 [Thauera terpenica]|jgi:hypothetical protein
MPGNGSRIWFKARNFGLGLRTVTSDMKTPLYMHDGSAAADLENTYSPYVTIRNL